MSIRDWPAAERPREKLLRQGAQALSDSELLAIFLGSGRRGRDAVSLARDALGEAGSLAQLLGRVRGQAGQRRPFGPATRCRLLAALELGERVLHESFARGGGVSSPDCAAKLFQTRLRGRPSEVFAAAFLDSRHRLIAFEELFQGSIDGAEVHAREVALRCLQHNAAAVVFGHNHPSGVAEPSAADRQITQRLRNSLELFDVRVLDHFVIGEGSAVSLAERGWL